MNIGIEQIILQFDFLDEHFCMEHISLIDINVNSVVFIKCSFINIILYRGYIMVYKKLFTA